VEFGGQKSHKIQLAVMVMWKTFRNGTEKHAPHAAILYDKFHVLSHLNEALDKVRKKEYARLLEKDRQYVKGQKYILLSRWKKFSLEGRDALKTLF
jgi:transposase